MIHRKKEMFVRKKKNLFDRKEKKKWKEERTKENSKKKMLIQMASGEKDVQLKEILWENGDMEK